MRTNFSLSAKISIIIIIAVMIPLVVLSGLTIRTIRSIALGNLESFVLENGSRRQAAIESDLRDSLNVLNEFLNANERILIQGLVQQSTGIQNEDAESFRVDIQSRIRTQLIETNYYNSVRILSEFYFPYTTVVRQDQIARDTLQGQRESVSAIADRLNISEGDIQVFGVTSRDDQARVEVLTALLIEDENGNPQLQGYLLVDLNLDEIFVDNLESTELAFNTFAYVIVERNDTTIVLAPDTVRDNTLFDVTSFGAERALSNLASGVDIYDVTTNDEMREVVGYSAALTIDDETFALISEVNTSELFTILGQQTTGQIFVGATVLTVIVLIMCLLAANQLVLPPIRGLRTAMLAIIRGDFDADVPARNRQDEMGSLATSFVDMRDYIRNLNDDMNQRLQDRTRDVQITQDIARAVTAERDLDTLMSRVVTLITQNFPSIYHAQIFLLDNDKQNAILRASTGIVGRELLARGHKISVGSVSVIGQVTDQGQVIVERDTSASNLHRQNQFLGETRAELGIPLSLGDVIIGALDVQSKQRNTFEPEQIAALQTLADQITIAIENTRLYAESERLLRETEAERGRATRRAWQQHVNQLRQSDITMASGAKTGYNFQKLTDAVMMSGEPIVGETTNRDTVPFVVPVKLRNQILGVVEYEIPKAEFEYDKVLLAQELVSRLAISLENARLFQASEQAADRERIVNDISAKLTNQTDIQGILQTAVLEIEQALRTPQVAIRLTSKQNGTSNGHSNGNGNAVYPNDKHPENTSQHLVDAE